MLAAFNQTLLRQTRSLLGKPLLGPLGDAIAIDDLLAQLNPTWSLTEVRARVVRRVVETADATTLVLQPNALWAGFAAGQHVAVTVQIDGVRCTRTYSLSGAPADGGTIAITVKRQADGKVSNWLNRHAGVGTVLTLSAAHGDFVLPAVLPAKLLMISAGSGITPVMSMLRDLAARTHRPAVTFLHSCRGADDAIFGAELRALARAWPTLDLRIVHTAQAGRLTAATLSQLVPDFAVLPTYLCGPQDFMTMVEDLYAAHGASTQIRCERFGAPPRRIADGAPARIDCTVSGKGFTADTANALLAQAEEAGLEPRSGCRIGICQTCRCRKASGTVENLVTGEISAEPGEMIQLCISAARSDLVLDL